MEFDGVAQWRFIPEEGMKEFTAVVQVAAGANAYIDEGIVQ